jgi:hypothetical protein
MDLLHLEDIYKDIQFPESILKNETTNKQYWILNPIFQFITY